MFFRGDAYIPSHLDKQTRNNYLRIFTESEREGTKVNSINENTHLYGRKANNRNDSVHSWASQNYCPFSNESSFIDVAKN